MVKALVIRFSKPLYSCNVIVRGIIQNILVKL